MHSSCQRRRIPLLTVTIAYFAVTAFYVSRRKTGLRARNASKWRVKVGQVRQQEPPQSFSEQPLNSKSRRTDEEPKEGRTDESVSKVLPAPPRVSRGKPVQFARGLKQSSSQSLSKEQLISHSTADEEPKEGSKYESLNQVSPAPRVSYGTRNRNGDEVKDAFRDAYLRFYTDDARDGTSMCRFSRACVNTDGDLLLPVSFERFRLTIAKECKLENSRLLFYNPDSDLRTLDSVRTRHHSAKHLAGLETLRFHIPHMVSDLLKYTVVLFPYLHRLSDTRNITVSCYVPDNSSSGAREYSCDSNPPQLSSVLVEKRARSIGWVPGIFQLLQRPSSAAPLEALYTDEAFPVEASGIKQRTNESMPRNACFASISVTGKALPSLTAHALHQGLLTQPAIAREIEDVPKHLPCRINVTIINRPVVRQIKKHLSTESRRVVNTDSVRKALLTEAHRLNVSINLSERTDFHKISFQEQFKVMQETHSLISVHGAELGNIIFLRRRSTLVEIFPFRYRAGIFEGLAKTVGIVHEAVTAKPDVEGYRKCMLGLFPPESPNQSEAQLEVTQFEHAATSFLAAKKSGEHSSVEKHFDGNTTKVGSAARICARSQRLVVTDPNSVAREALKNFKQLCYGD